MKEKHCTGSCRLCETATMLININKVASDVNNNNRFCFFLTRMYTNNNVVPDVEKKNTMVLKQL